MVEEAKEKQIDPPDWNSVKSHVLHKNSPAPIMIDVKDLLRFYVKRSKGQI